VISDQKLRAELPDVGQNLANLSRQLAALPNRRVEFHESGQLFIRSRHETLSIATMRICNPDRSPVGINR
jgi:hypothetical protein